MCMRVCVCVFVKGGKGTAKTLDDEGGDHSETRE